jgi:hypothetical protein
MHIITRHRHTVIRNVVFEMDVVDTRRQVLIFYARV